MRYKCKCGETLSNTQVPNDIELTVYTDIEWDNIINMGDLIDPVMIPHPQVTVFQCTNCGRIHIFKGYHWLKTYIEEKDYLENSPD